MFDIKDGKISLNKTRTLSTKQMVILNRMGTERAKNQYLLSILGLVKKEKQWINKFKSTGEDRLAGKRVNTILKQMTNLKYVNIDHHPTQKHVGQWVGVEVECFIPHDACNSRRYGHNDCECETDDDGNCEYECTYCRNGPSPWSEKEAHEWLEEKLENAGVHRVCVKDDGSLSDEEGTGVECTILFNSAYGFEPLERLCNALTDNGCYVNKTCGLHIHLDARHLKAKGVLKIGESLGHALPMLKWLVPKSRHNNTYCRLGVSPLRGERYHAVNLTSFNKYQTIEIRLHGGSINAEKITNWIKLIKLLGAAKLTKDISTFQDLIDIDGMSEELIAYADKRITELNPDAWPRLMPCEFSAWPRVMAPITIYPIPIGA